MSEEEKKAIETVENFIKYYKKNEQTGNRANLDVLREECQAIEFMLNKYDVTQKELNNIKEIEKSHKEENGKLRVELEQEKEKNKKLEATNKAFHRFIMFNGGKDIEDITATEYMRIRQEGYNDGRYDEQQKAEEIIMNNYISKDIIKQEIKNIERRMEMSTNSTEYQKLHCAQEYLRGLLWEE